MNAKLIFGVGLPFLIVLLLIGLSVFGGEFEKELEFKEVISNETQQIGTFKITNDYFMPRKAELPNLIACPYFEGEAKDPLLNLNFGGDVWAGSYVEFAPFETKEYSVYLYGLVYDFPVKDMEMDEIKIYELDMPYRYTCSGLSGEIASIQII